MHCFLHLPTKSIQSGAPTADLLFSWLVFIWIQNRPRSGLSAAIFSRIHLDQRNRACSSRQGCTSPI
jgi:hypothetical protein